MFYSAVLVEMCSGNYHVKGTFTDLCQMSHHYLQLIETQTHTHTQTQIHEHTNTHTHKHKHTQTHKHTHTHTRARTHMHTHTHTANYYVTCILHLQISHMCLGITFAKTNVQISCV